MDKQQKDNEIDAAVKTCLKRAIKIVDDVCDPVEKVGLGTKLVAATNLVQILISINMELFEKELDDEEENEGGFSSQSE